MSILSTNHRLISIGESYSAGNGIDITDQVISVTGDVMPYSAGENIDIQSHVISGKDWSQDITDASSNAFNETTAWVHDNYANSADVSYLSGVVDNKLDSSAWSSVSSNFATEDYVIMADNITYDRTIGYVENQQFAKESACQSAFEQLNTNKLDASSFTDWQNGQYSTDLQTIEGQIANKLDTSSFSEASGSFQPRGDYVERNTVYSAIESATSGKLDVSSFASVSSDFLTTSFGISESATWNDVSETVQTNSAQWADGGSGDEEVNSFVYNNSATINEVNTTYQQYSASYQPSGNYIPYTAYGGAWGYQTDNPITVKNVAFTATLQNSNIQLFNNVNRQTVLSPTDLRFKSNDASAQVDISSIKNWNDVSTTVQSNSAQWAEGGGSNPEVESYVINNSATIDEVNTTYQSNSASYLTAHQSLADYYTTAEANTLSSMLSGAIDYVSANAGGNVPVSNSGDLYKVEFDGVDLYGYKSTTTIPAEPFYSAVSSQESTYIQHTPYPQWNNQAIQGLLYWSAFDVISISSNGGQIRPPEYPYGLTALDVYYQAKYVYDYNNNSLPDFSGYVGKITLDNLVISSYFDKPSYYDNIARCDQFRLWFSGNEHEGQINNHYICSVGTEVQSDPETIEGIFVPSSTDLSNYYTKSETSGASEIADALANIPTGNPEVETYVQTNSATINEVNTSYQTNSGDYIKESELEYNAVNEISGIAGSAIAQYGAEKQWLVHDDTLVHVANSAQYALGVNLSAISGLLINLFGLDETMLWSGSNSTTSVMNFSEPYSSFKKLRFEYKDNNDISCEQVIPTENINTNIVLTSFWTNTANGSFLKPSLYQISSNGIQLKNGCEYSFSTSYSRAGTTNKLTMTKIYGIGRKA